jgi:hypothetical protein
VDHPLDSFRRRVVLVVEYDKGNRRAAKVFTCPVAARRFYGQKYRAGLRPRLVRPR